jgi:hypothetical protein
LSGLAKIARMYGGMTINGVHYVWDYVKEEAVPEKEMKQDPERWKASERKRFELLKAQQYKREAP